MDNFKLLAQLRTQTKKLAPSELKDYKLQVNCIQEDNNALVKEIWRLQYEIQQETSKHAQAMQLNIERDPKQKPVKVDGRVLEGLKAQLAAVKRKHAAGPTFEQMQELLAELRNKEIEATGRSKIGDDSPSSLIDSDDDSLSSPRM